VSARIRSPRATGTSTHIHNKCHPSSVTRENNYRLLKQRCHYDLRKFPFTNRIVNIWNSLPKAVVEVYTVDNSSQD